MLISQIDVTPTSIDITLTSDFPGGAMPKEILDVIAPKIISALPKSAIGNVVQKGIHEAENKLIERVIQANQTRSEHLGQWDDGWKAGISLAIEMFYAEFGLEPRQLMDEAWMSDAKA